MGEQPIGSGSAGISTPVKVTIAVVVVAAAIAVGIALMDGDSEDDRPPIIVRNGSLIFDGGDPAVPNRWKDWSKDTFLGEWKPTHADGKPVRDFEVTFAGVTPPAGCTAPLRGETIWIDYTTDGSSTTRFRIHIRKKNMVGKREPKIDPGSASLSPRVVASAPPLIAYEDNASGWVSKVTVGATECTFSRPSPSPSTARGDFRVRVQPKE